MKKLIFEANWIDNLKIRFFFYTKVLVKERHYKPSSEVREHPHYTILYIYYIYMYIDIRLYGRLSGGYHDYSQVLWANENMNVIITQPEVIQRVSDSDMHCFLCVLWHFLRLLSTEQQTVDCRLVDWNTQRSSIQVGAASVKFPSRRPCCLLLQEPAIQCRLRLSTWTLTQGDCVIISQSVDVSLYLSVFICTLYCICHNIFPASLTITAHYAYTPVQFILPSLCVSVLLLVAQ